MRSQTSDEKGEAEEWSPGGIQVGQNSRSFNGTGDSKSVYPSQYPHVQTYNTQCKHRSIDGSCTIQPTSVTSKVTWLPEALLYVWKSLHLVSYRRWLDLPVRYIRVSNGQCLNDDLKAPEESAKAEDNRT